MLSHLSTFFGTLLLCHALLWGIPAHTSAQSAPQLTTPEEIVVAVPRYFPPYYQIDANGQPEGLAIMLLDLVAKHANLRTQFEIFNTLEEAQDAVAQGRADLIPLLSIEPDSQRRFAFTPQVDGLNIVLFKHVHDETVFNTQAMQGVRVGGLFRTEAIKQLQLKHGATLTFLHNPQHLLNALLSDKVDLIAAPRTLMQRLARDIRITDQLEEVGQPLETTPLAMAVRQTDSPLHSRLSAALQAVVASPSWRAAQHQWYRQPDSRPRLAAITWIVTGTLFGLLVIWVIWKAVRTKLGILTYLFGNPKDSYERTLRLRGLGLTMVMVLAVAATALATLALLYNTALEEQRQRLVDTVRNQARLMEAVARFDQEYSSNFPTGTRSATLSQVKDAHSNFYGLSEFTLGERVGDQIIFIFRQHASDRYQPAPVALSSSLAEPMRRALSGLSGTVVGLDYRGVEVMAAYEPVSVLNLGLVAKVDIADIQQPFVEVAWVAAATGVLILMLGSVAFITLGHPVVHHVVEQENLFRSIFEQAGVGVALIDSHSGQFLRINKRYCEMLGFTPEEMSNATFQAITHPDDLQHDLDNMALLRSGAIDGFSMEKRYICKDGSIVWVDLTVSPTWLAGETPNQHIAVVDDITARKQMEQALQASEARFHAIFDHSFQFIGLLTPQGILLEANQTVLELAGIDAEEVIGKPFWESVWWSDSREKQKRLQQGIAQAAQGALVRFETTHLDREGATVYVDFSLKPVKDSQGNVVQLIPEGRDITERKQLEMRLSMLSQAMENALNAFDIIDQDGRFIYVNKAYVEMWGYQSVDEILGTSPIDHCADPMMPMRIIGELREQGTCILEFKAKRKDGSLFDVLMYARLDHDEQGREIYPTTTIDISEHRKAEAALKASEERYRAIAEDSPSMICRFLPGGEIDYVNQQYCDYFQLSPETLVGSSFLQFIPAHERDRVIAEIEALTQKSPTQSHEHPVHTPQGDIGWQRWTNRAMFDKEGTPLVYQSIGEDITQQKKAEEMLRESEERFRQLYEQAPLGYQSLDDEGNFLDVNQAWLNMLGYDRDEVIGQSFQAFLMKDGVMASNLPQFKRDGKIVLQQTQMRCKDGSEKLVHIDGRIGYDNQGEFVRTHCILTDVTERTIIERQLRQSHKMEAIGTLAGGIAHDFNNILGVIMGYSEMTLKNPEITQTVQQDLQEVLTATIRARDLVAQLLTFSRQQEDQISPTLIIPIIKETMKFMRATTPAHIEIKTRIEAKDLIVNCSPTQIHQLMMNLGTNASQAMGQHPGTLTCTVSNRSLDTKQAKPYGLKAGDYAEITLEDTGPGIPQEIQHRIFDPFYTTKAVNQGTGLGLSVVHGIVQSIHGHIYFISPTASQGDEAAGVLFTLLLPIVAAEVGHQREASEQISHFNNLRVLLLDDEVTLMGMMEMMLEQLGIETLGFSDPYLALKQLEKEPESVDCLLVDYAMPGMTGIEFIMHAKKLNPQLVSIICSGFEPTITADELKQNSIRYVLQKPLMQKDLSDAMAGVYREQQLRDKQSQG
uniref:histidine kinase n=1 Tax=Magnetococcus massalia (strain MO-1) TaxID=451514 RepID=A0A1S7LK37_MAGMO|nr:Putative histidine kinase with SBP bac 3 (Bacterial extracellular solute-binding proteins, family 3_domain, PAS 3 domain, two PAS 4 domain, PAS domain, HisKA domain, HATPase c domain and one response regulator receiver domain [Candidatus Magnetococcus massalia]